MNEITIYTDGAAEPNPGKGGCAAIIISGDARYELSNSYQLTTNNRMELMAAIMAIEDSYNVTDHFTLYSDSQYVINPMTKGWLGNWMSQGIEQRKNADLWKRIHPYYKRPNLVFKWIRGHSGNVENEKCDALANAACYHPNKLIDEGYANPTSASNTSIVVYKVMFCEGYDDDSDHTKSIHKTHEGAQLALDEYVKKKKKEHTDLFKDKNYDYMDFKVEPYELQN